MTINYVGENMRRLRENAGFTQMIIAKFLNVDQSLVSKIERGERTLSSDMLERIATLFGVTTTELITSKVEFSKFTYAFRGSELSADDLETISAINRIALNSDFMKSLIEGEKAW